MTHEMSVTEAGQDVPQALIQALFRRPQELQVVMHEAGLAPHQLAMWARQAGDAPDIEKLAGWLAVGQRLGDYKPLLEVAASHLRAGDLLEALPVFRWAYQSWQGAPARGPKHYQEGVKLLALWGECLFRLKQPEAATRRWLRSLDLIRDEETLKRLAQTVERSGAAGEYQAVLDEALRRDLPGAGALWQRWQRVSANPRAETPPSEGTVPHMAPEDAPGVAVMADVANLDMVCGEQYGFGWRLDYGRLLQLAASHGPTRVKMAFVPDIPETLSVREHLEQVGFQVDLQRPKRSHGRMVANADTAMASFAVRWAGDPGIGRLELWTGDGDFLRVREAVHQAWPGVEVVFRSFEVGTSSAIRQLAGSWHPIDAGHVHPIAYP